jgi:stage IV sporulation protein A
LHVRSEDLATCISCGLCLNDCPTYRILGDECGYPIEDDYHLVSIVKGLVGAKKEYDRLSGALDAARKTGYGLVPPMMDEMSLEEPEMVRQGGRFGVRLKASAPSLHLIRVDIQTEVSPIVGSEKQSEDLVKYLMSEFENDPAKIWNTDIFGKSLHELVKEGLSGKLSHMPEDARMKIQETLQRIINEGSGGLICILL